MDNKGFKKKLFFSILFFCFLAFLGITIGNANTITNEEYLKEVERIKALPPMEGYEAWLELNRVPKLYVDTRDDTGKLHSYEGKTYNKGKIDYESWLGEDGEEYQGKQKNSFQYYGTDSDCTDLEGGERIACRAKHLFWNKGTLKLAGSLVVEGMGLAMNYFDSAGMHWIMSGVYEPVYNALGFDTKNKRLIFGNNVFIEKNFSMTGFENFLFLKSDNSTEKISQNKNNIKVSSGGNSLTTYENTRNRRNSSYELPQNADYFYTHWRARSSGGLEIEDYLRTEEMLYQNYLLLYCMPTLDNSIRPLYQACEIEEDSDRMHNDNFIYQLNEDPPLPDPVGCSDTPPAIAGPGCTPQCGGRQCGSDSCGGSCGACGADQECEEGSCVGYVWKQSYSYIGTQVNHNYPDCPGGSYPAGVVLGEPCNRGQRSELKCVDGVTVNAVGANYYIFETAICVAQ